MSTADQIAGTLRPLAPDRKFTPHEVELINLIAAEWDARRPEASVSPRPVLGIATPPEPEIAPGGQQAKPAGAKTLAEPIKFFAAVRSSLFGGHMDTPQIEGLNALLKAMGAAGWPIAYAAYALATAYHETAKTMQPVREAFWLSEDWRRKHLRYYPHYGRGYVQLTWLDNYKWADRELGLNGALLADLDLAMKPEHAAAILVKGMAQGAFSKDKQGPRSLARYLPEDRPATLEEFRLARPIINIMDKASEIAAIAVKFQDAMKGGGWS